MPTGSMRVDGGIYVADAASRPDHSDSWQIAPLLDDVRATVATFGSAGDPTFHDLSVTRTPRRR